MQQLFHTVGNSRMGRVMSSGFCVLSM